jgi:hypothetical protein
MIVGSAVAQLSLEIKQVIHVDVVGKFSIVVGSVIMTCQMIVFTDPTTIENFPTTST